MKFWDNMKKFAQPYADDDYDDYDDDEYMDDYEEEVEEEPVRRAPKASRTRRTAAPAPEAEAEVQEEASFADDYAFSSLTKSAPAAASSDFGGRVLNMNRGGKQGIVLFRPSSFSDADKAADDLKKNQAVIVNLENVEKTMARRVVDFLSGCVYAMDGKVSKIAQSAYLFSPNQVDVTGTLETQAADIEQYV